MTVRAECVCNEANGEMMGAGNAILQKTATYIGRRINQSDRQCSMRMVGDAKLTVLFPSNIP